MFEPLRQLTFWSMLLRILLAAVTGGIIGLERERKNRGAGFRTYMLVGIGAASTIMLSQYLDLMMNTQWADIVSGIGIRTDVSRFGAQVINGIGFLGAGTILVTERQDVKGLTTAAGLWASACMGLASGAGFYECVVFAFLLILFSMSILPKMEDFIVNRSRNMNIYAEMGSIENLGELMSRIKSESVEIFDVEIDKIQNEKLVQINVVMNLCLPKKLQRGELLAKVSESTGVIYLEEIQ